MRNRLREWRQRRGYTQQQLAERTGVTRQTVGGLEAGQYGPGVDVALRLARALGCTVEDLFALPPEGVAAHAITAAGRAGPFRVALGQFGGRLVARPLDGLGQPAAAHGIAGAHPAKGIIQVERFPQAGRGLFLTGCDPALGLLCGHVDRAHTGVDALWWNAGNAEARAQLAQGAVHAAALHQPREQVGDGQEAAARFRLGSWQMGFATAPGNPKGILGPEALARPDVRLVNREPGAGARQLLDRLLQSVDLQPAAIPGYRREAHGHREVAAAVALGAADLGICHGAAAAEYGLHFLPLADEVCDLLLAPESLGAAEVASLLDALCSGAFRADLSAFGPYDTARTGDRIA